VGLGGKRKARPRHYSFATGLVTGLLRGPTATWPCDHRGIYVIGFGSFATQALVIHEFYKT